MTVRPQDKLTSVELDSLSCDEKAARIAALVLEAAIKEVAKLSFELDQVGKSITRASELMRNWDEITGRSEATAIFQLGQLTSFPVFAREYCPGVDEQQARAMWLTRLDELRETELDVLTELSDSDGPIVVRIERS